MTPRRSDLPEEVDRNLRRDAEMRLKGIVSGPRLQEDAAHLLHELQVHQYELELQKEALAASVEELELSKVRLEELSARYESLFDFAPIGYLTLDEGGVMTEVNVTFAAMVGFPRGVLIGMNITELIHRDDQDVFHFHRMTLKGPHARSDSDFRLKTADGSHVDVRLHSRRFDPNAIRIAVIDITDRMWIRKKRALIQDSLEIANRSLGLSDLLAQVVAEIKRFLECEAVGIRVLDEDGRIPYQACDGFSRAFYETENPLSIHADHGMCVSVLRGDTPKDRPFFTTGGSFYVNGTTQFLRTVPESERGAGRNVCHQYGYESLALVPIPFGGKKIGLIHAADHRENLFRRATVEALEELAAHLGIIVNRVVLSDRLRSSLEELRQVSSRLLQAQEEERKRIAAELHDQTGQDLNYLKLTLWNFAYRLPEDQQALKADLEKTMAFTDRIIDNVRDLLHGLSPSVLKDLGLVPALEGLIDDFSEYIGIRATGDVSALEGLEFDFDSQIALYRIVQEILTNISKHARASAVRVSSLRDGGWVEIRIEDDGKGFSRPEGKPALNRGLGLSSMVLRCQLIGASLSFEHREGAGTRAVLRCPVKARTA